MNTQYKSARRRPMQLLGNFNCKYKSSGLAAGHLYCMDKIISFCGRDDKGLVDVNISFEDVNEIKKQKSSAYDDNCIIVFCLNDKTYSFVGFREFHNAYRTLSSALRKVHKEKKEKEERREKIKKKILFEKQLENILAKIQIEEQKEEEPKAIIRKYKENHNDKNYKETESLINLDTNVNNHSIELEKKSNNENSIISNDNVSTRQTLRDLDNHHEEENKMDIKEENRLEKIEQTNPFKTPVAPIAAPVHDSSIDNKIMSEVKEPMNDIAENDVNTDNIVRNLANEIEEENKADIKKVISEESTAPLENEWDEEELELVESCDKNYMPKQVKKTPQRLLELLFALLALTLYAALGMSINLFFKPTFLQKTKL